jgi:hypothetical protein
MLLFSFLMFVNPVWRKRYEKLNTIDKDSVTTVFGIVEETFLFLIYLYLIVKYTW